MRTAKDVGDRLREAGIRVTTPRIAVYDYLLTHRTHPTCDEIYTGIKVKNPDLSLASVSPDGERHYDAITDFHAHFFCNDCGKIFDVDCEGREDLIQLQGAVIDSIAVSAYGRCPFCAGKSRD